MCRVFLVDDEIAAREMIRKSIPWAELGLELIGEAADGEIALSMLREMRPDVLITDIRMPYMDGMELCRKVSREMPETRVMIVSACEDFACAREALALGVRAYLTKPVDATALREALMCAAAECRERKRREIREASFREYMAASGRYLRGKLLEEIYSGADAEMMLRFARAMRIDLAAKRYLVMVFRPEQHASSKQEAAALRGALEQLAEVRGGTAFLQRDESEFSLLLLGDDSEHLKKRADELARAVGSELARTAGFGMLIAIGRDVEELGRVPESLADARSQLDMDAVHRRETWGRIAPEVLTLSEIDGPPLGEMLKYASMADVDAIVDRCAKTLDAAHSDLLEHHFFVDVLLESSRIIRECQGDPQEVIPEACRAQSGARDMLELCRDTLRRAVAFRDSQGSARYGSVIRKAQAYIDERFADSGLTLGDVAAHVALSNNHFCTIFSREMGVTFIEYLTAVRVHRAEELLRSTNMRTSEVAYAVGYNDPHYFSYLFKKNTGASPRDYRRNAGAPRAEEIK